MRYFYGIDNHKIDIGDIIYKKCLHNNRILIPRESYLKDNLFTDPCIFHKKYVYIEDNYGNTRKFCQDEGVDLDISSDVIFPNITRINDLDEINKIPINEACYLYLNGKSYIYHNYEKSNIADHIQSWGAFGMTLKTHSYIIKYIESICPNNIMLLLVEGDYHKSINPIFFTLYPKIIQLNRYIDIANPINSSETLIIPSDDNLFNDYTIYRNPNLINIEDRINKVFWRGSNTNSIRKVIVKKYIDNPNFDIKLIHNQFSEDIYESNKRLFGNNVDQFEPSKYTIWLSIEGWGLASDTSRALLSGCAVVYFRQTKPWFDKYLESGVNCCIAENLKELDEHLNELINNRYRTNDIGNAGKKLANIIFEKKFVEKYLYEEIRSI
jgi:hypothetical protein